MFVKYTNTNKSLIISIFFAGNIVFCTNNGPVGAVEADGSVECIAFPPNNDLKVVATGTLQGQIAIWDYTKYGLRTLCDHTFTEGDESDSFQGGITRYAYSC